MATVIHAPTPQRHFVESSARQHWLETPPISPSTSRGPSPLSQTFPEAQQQQRHRWPSIDATYRRASFGNHYTDRPGQQGLRQRQVSNASIASTYTNYAGPSNLHKALLKTKHTQAAHAETEPASSGRRWVRWMHNRGLRAWVAPSAIAFATLLKLCLGANSYSGESHSAFAFPLQG